MGADRDTFDPALKDVYDKGVTQSVASNNFIKGAIKKPGAMTAAAKREGVSNSEYEQEHKHDSGKAGQRARFAVVLKGLQKAHK